MRIFKEIVLLFIVSNILCNDQAGVKIAVRQDVIVGFERKFIPLLADKLSNLDIPGTQIDLDAKIGTLHINLDNIHFQVRNLIAENIEISFGEPNKIFANARNIQGNGHLDVRFKLGFLSETDSVEVRINNVNGLAEITLGTQESSKEQGKLMPSAQITDVKIDIDFDFDISGKVVAFIADLVKSKIKSYINDAIQSKLRDVIIEETRGIIADLIDQLPVYVPIGDQGLALDYSLLSAPKVSNGYLLLNSNGAIINLNVPETKSPPFPFPTTLPDYDLNGKPIQLFLSDYSINTAINSLFLSNMLNVEIKSEIVPQDSPIQLNTNFLDSLVSGLAALYGKDKLVDIVTNVANRPDVWIEQNRVNATVTAEIALLVRLDETNREEAIRFITTVKLSGDAHVQSEGQISAYIHDVALVNSTLIQSKVKDANINNIEVFFNYAAKFALPIINNNYLKNITVKLPTVEGISFEDSTVDIKEQHLELNVNPRFTDNLFNKYLLRKHQKSQDEFEMKLFLSGL